MKRIPFLFCLLVMKGICFAQDALKLPTILPATPEASSIIKGGELSVNMHTGTANASIPLYAMKLHDFTLPIALDYSGNGLKVDEIPSRVGLGWNLSSYGVVTRIVHDKPDDQADSASIAANFPQGDSATLVAFNGVSVYDHEPDEFSFNAPGISGKFVLDSAGNAVQLPYGNLKITVSKASGRFYEITITNTNGIVYKFGGQDKNGNKAYENTLNHENFNGNEEWQNIRTGFFLKAIILPDGESIDYYYTDITFTTNPGVNHTLTHPISNPNAQTCPCHYQCGGGSCPEVTYNTDGTFNEALSNVEYQTIYLDSIYTSNGQSASFNYENRPDGAGDKRITSIQVNAGDFSKNYHLIYADPSTNSYYTSFSGGEYNKRFFLAKVYYVLSNGDASTDTLTFKCDYIDTAALPNRLSYCQDHLGFFNGSLNANLIPPNYLLTGTSNYAQADRGYHGSYAQKGMLSKITFPTGGYQEFIYEPNVTSSNELIHGDGGSITVSGSGNTSGGTYQTLTYYSYTFLCDKSQTAHGSFWAYQNPACSTCTPPPANTEDLAWLNVMDVSTFTALDTFLLREYNTDTFSVHLDSGHIYNLKLRVRGLPNAATAVLNYQIGDTTTHLVHHEAGGVRVKQVNSYDPVSSKTNSKYYKYASVSNLAISSGKSWAHISYSITTNNRAMCTFECQYGPDNDYCANPYRSFSDCYSQTISSSSSNALYLYNGSHIGYQYIVESDDSSFVNGGIEHKFNVDELITSEGLVGQPMPNLPNNTATTLSGAELATNYFNKNFQTVKRQDNYYSLDSITTVKAYSIQIKYTGTLGFLGEDPIHWDDIFDIYNISRYSFISSWIKFDSTVTTDYDASTNTLTSKIFYYYGSSANTEPTKIKTFTSTGDSLISEMTYPNDYGSTPYTTMVSRNIISPVIQTKQTRNTSEINRVRTSFKQWWSSGDNIVIEPDTVFSKKGSNSEESRLRYYAYDNSSNPLEVAKENGEKISYIWDYNKSFPVAEIKNAGVTIDSFAYSSFEADGKGYWIYSGSAISESFQPTGSHCYNLSNGNITRGVNSSKSYFVTYWKKDSSGTVNVNSTTATALISRNGWTCYQHLISSSSTVTVSGTAKIDELRLYPVGSFMTTFTYRTFVGISSRDEPNNQISYYEYDDGARLRLIRDMDRNIIKRFEYQYQKQIYPCSDTSANWVSTGAVRCVKTNDHYNNNTGVQEYEQRDMNNCSPTYLHTRWLSNGTQSACAAISCSGADKRVINGVCTAGTKVLVSSLQLSSTSWQCIFHYVWSDGYVGDNFTETHTNPCWTPDE